MKSVFYFKQFMYKNFPKKKFLMMTISVITVGILSIFYINADSSFVGDVPIVLRERHPELVSSFENYRQTASAAIDANTQLRSMGVTGQDFISGKYASDINLTSDILDYLHGHSATIGAQEQVRQLFMNSLAQYGVTSGYSFDSNTGAMQIHIFGNAGSPSGFPAGNVVQGLTGENISKFSQFVGSSENFKRQNFPSSSGIPESLFVTIPEQELYSRINAFGRGPAVIQFSMRSLWEVDPKNLVNSPGMQVFTHEIGHMASAAHDLLPERSVVFYPQNIPLESSPYAERFRADEVVNHIKNMRGYSGLVSRYDKMIDLNTNPAIETSLGGHMAVADKGFTVSGLRASQLTAVSLESSVTAQKILSNSAPGSITIIHADPEFAGRSDGFVFKDATGRAFMNIPISLNSANPHAEAQNVLYRSINDARNNFALIHTANNINGTKDLSIDNSLVSMVNRVTTTHPDLVTIINATPQTPISYLTSAVRAQSAATEIMEVRLSNPAAITPPDPMAVPVGTQSDARSAVVEQTYGYGRLGETQRLAALDVSRKIADSAVGAKGGAVGLLLDFSTFMIKTTEDASYEPPAARPEFIQSRMGEAARAIPMALLHEGVDIGKIALAFTTAAVILSAAVSAPLSLSAAGLVFLGSLEAAVLVKAAQGIVTSIHNFEKAVYGASGSRIGDVVGGLYKGAVDAQYANQPRIDVNIDGVQKNLETDNGTQPIVHSITGSNTSFLSDGHEVIVIATEALAQNLAAGGIYPAGTIAATEATGPYVVRLTAPRATSLNTKYFMGASGAGTTYPESTPFLLLPDGSREYTLSEGKVLIKPDGSILYNNNLGSRSFDSKSNTWVDIENNGQFRMYYEDSLSSSRGYSFVEGKNNEFFYVDSSGGNRVSVNKERNEINIGNGATLSQTSTDSYGNRIYTDGTNTAIIDRNNSLTINGLAYSLSQRVPSAMLDLLESPPTMPSENLFSGSAFSSSELDKLSQVSDIGMLVGEVGVAKDLINTDSAVADGLLVALNNRIDSLPVTPENLNQINFLKDQVREVTANLAVASFLDEQYSLSTLQNLGSSSTVSLNPLSSTKSAQLLDHITKSGLPYQIVTDAGKSYYLVKKPFEQGGFTIRVPLAN